MTDVVLDASAVLALLFAEVGADVVRGRIRGGLISTVNVAEVLTKLVDKGMPIERAVDVVEILGMKVVPLSVQQARLLSALRPATRAAGLSLGDRSCLALAQERGLTAVTAERRWPDVAKVLGILVEAIR